MPLSLQTEQNSLWPLFSIFFFFFFNGSILLHWELTLRSTCLDFVQTSCLQKHWRTSSCSRSHKPSLPCQKRRPRDEPSSKTITKVISRHPPPTSTSSPPSPSSSSLFSHTVLTTTRPEHRRRWIGETHGHRVVDSSTPPPRTRTF